MSEKSDRDQLQRYRILARISTDWFWETNPDYVITYMSDSVERITGFPKDKYIGVSRYDLASSETKSTEAWRRHIQAIANHEEIKNFEYQHVGDDGRIVYLRVNAVPLFNDDGTFRGYLGSTTDISELVTATRNLAAANQELVKRAHELEAAKLAAEEMARTDALTGLNNRRAFFEQAMALNDVAVRYEQAYSVIMLDIDHFKSINDTYGHDVGDKAIKVVADTIQGVKRVSDISGRLGGEEFGILLPQTLVDNAGMLAERLRESVSAKRIDIDQESISVTASFGVTQYSMDGASIDQVLSNADKALYKAKNAGRNRVVVL